MKDIHDQSQHVKPLAGSYRLLQLLGPGPLSRTYLAEHQDLPGQKFALKIMEAAPIETESARDQVLQEVLARKKLQELHILSIEEAWVQDRVLYLVSPYIEAGTEAGSLRQRLSTSTPLSLKESLLIIKGLGEALHFAHLQNIVHANLKPENVLLAENSHALLVDFLIPTLTRPARAARTYATFAAHYMAPEQFQQGPATPLSDQYALACLACELLTGHTPFEADDFETLAQKHLTEVPSFKVDHNREQIQHLEKIVLQALAKRPEDRFADVQEFVTALSTPPSLAPYVQTVIMPAITVPDPQPALILVSPPELQSPAGSPTIQDAPAYQPQPDLYASAPVPTRLRAARPATRITSKQRWLIIAIVVLTMCLTLSAVLVLFQLSGNQPTTPGISQSISSHQTAIAGGNSPTATNAQTPVATTQAGVTPTSTPAATTLTPSPTVKPGATPTTSTGAAVTGCSVSYTVTSNWGSGFIASIKVTNAGNAPINGWTLLFAFPAGQQITNGWNGTFTQNGSQVSVSDASYNAQIQPGNSVSAGFQGSSNNSTPVSNTSPTTFTLNGTACSIVAA